MNKKLVLLVVIAANAFSWCDTDEESFKCVEGMAASALVQKLHGTHGLDVYHRARNKLKALNPQLELCYRADTHELIILNSKSIASSSIRLAVAPWKHDVWLLHMHRRLSTGEKVLKFQSHDDGTFEILSLFKRNPQYTLGGE